MIEKVFRDPVHTYIHVDHQVIYDLILKNFNDYAASSNWEHLVTLSMVVSIAVFRIVWEPMKSLDGLPKSSMRNIFKPGTITSLFW